MGLAYERGALYSVGLDGAMKSWDVERGAQTAQGCRGSSGAPMLADKAAVGRAAAVPGVRCVSGLELGHTGQLGTSLYSVAASGPTVLAGGADGQVHMWDTREGRAAPLLGRVGRGVVRSLALFDIDQALLAAGEDAATLWDLRTRRAARCFSVPGLWRLGKSHTAVEAWACSKDGSVRRIGVNSGMCTTLYHNSDCPLSAVAEEPGGAECVWVGGCDGSITCVVKKKNQQQNKSTTHCITHCLKTTQSTKNKKVLNRKEDSEEEDEEAKEEEEEGSDNEKEEKGRGGGRCDKDELTIRKPLKTTETNSNSSSNNEKKGSEEEKEKGSEEEDGEEEKPDPFAEQTFSDSVVAADVLGKCAHRSRRSSRDDSETGEGSVVGTVRGDKTGIVRVRVLKDGEHVLTQNALGAVVLWCIADLTCKDSGETCEDSDASFEECVKRHNEGTPKEKGLPKGLRVDTSTGVFQVAVRQQKEEAGKRTKEKDSTGTTSTANIFQSIKAAAAAKGEGQVDAFLTETLSREVTVTTHHTSLKTCCACTSSSTSEADKTDCHDTHNTTASSP